MLQLRGECCSFNRLRTGSASASQGWPLARAIRPLSNASVAAHERNMHMVSSSRTFCAVFGNHASFSMDNTSVAQSLLSPSTGRRTFLLLPTR